VAFPGYVLTLGHPQHKISSLCQFQNRPPKTPEQALNRYSIKVIAIPSMDSELKGYVQGLIDALKTQYRLSQIKSNIQTIRNIREGSNNNISYFPNKEDMITHFQNQNRKLIKNEIGIDFELIYGKKYLKLILVDGSSRSVHCFIDIKTGDVYKPASWRAPAKHIRFNLRDPKSRQLCYDRANWHGGYLYM
jgi:hypothetical protein